MENAPDGSVTLDAEAALFGFEPSRVRTVITPRGRAWRLSGAGIAFGVSVVVAPLVAVVPPHAVWFIGALATGGFFARRRYVERFTLQSVDGHCPKCGADIQVKSTRLLAPHALPCDQCHHESTLRLPEGTLERIAKA